MAGWIKMPLGMEVGLGSGDFVLDGDQAPPSPKIGVEVGLGPGHIVRDGTQLLSPKRGQSPQFSAHLYCGQTAGCIKMPLGKLVWR